MGPKSSGEMDDENYERAPWEDGALTVDVTSVPAETVLRHCLSNDLPVRLTYMKGLAAAATRANKRELSKLLEALGTLLDDEALGVRLETLQQLQQLAKLVTSTAAPDDVAEAVVDAVEEQMRLCMDGGGPSSGGGANTASLPMVREAVLATLDAVCEALKSEGRAAALLSRLLRAANSALDKAAGSGGGAGGGAMGVGGGKGGADAALTALSMAAVAVRHLNPGRGGMVATALAERLTRHGDLRVREAVASALPLLYGPYVAHPGALEQLLTSYATLCNDKVWSVRQACARVAAAVSHLCYACDSGSGDSGNKDSGERAVTGVASGRPSYEPQGRDAQCTSPQHHAVRQRADELQHRLIRRLFLDTLLPTKSQWVVTAVRQAAGEMITSLRAGLVPELMSPLLEAYCAGAGAVGQGAMEVRRACAVSFADVVARAGAERWGQLQPVFVRLLACDDATTLCSLVASIERVVQVLADAPDSGDDDDDREGHNAAAATGEAALATGTDDAHRQQLRQQRRVCAVGIRVVSGPLMGVLVSQMHLVAPAVSASLAGLLRVSPPELQQQLLQLLPELCHAPANTPGYCGDWRRRLALAQQLHSAMTAVMATPTGPASIARAAVMLCTDPVWAVRHVAAVEVGRMLTCLSPVPSPLASPEPLSSEEGPQQGSTASTAGRNAVPAEVDADSSVASTACTREPEPPRAGSGDMVARVNNGGEGGAGSSNSCAGEGTAVEVGIDTGACKLHLTVCGGAQSPMKTETAEPAGNPGLAGDAGTEGICRYEDTAGLLELAGSGQDEKRHALSGLTPPQRNWLMLLTSEDATGSKGQAVDMQDGGRGAGEDVLSEVGTGQREGSKIGENGVLDGMSGSEARAASACYILVDWLCHTVRHGRCSDAALVAACCRAAVPDADRWAVSTDGGHIAAH